MIIEELKLKETVCEETETILINLIKRDRQKSINHYMRGNKRNNLLPVASLTSEVFGDISLSFMTLDESKIEEYCTKHAFVKLQDTNEFMTLHDFILMYKMNYHNSRDEFISGNNYKVYSITNKDNKELMYIAYLEIKQDYKYSYILHEVMIRGLMYKGG